MSEEYKPPVFARDAHGATVRLVDPKVCVGWMGLVNAGLLTMEDAMRELYPEEAARIYDLDHNR